MASQEGKTKKRKRRYLEQIPPLPIGAIKDEALELELQALGESLPGNLYTLKTRLDEISAYVEFDAALHQANVMVLTQLDDLLDNSSYIQSKLLEYATAYLPPEACVPICRRLIKAPDPAIQRKAISLARLKRPREVALPAEKDGDWSFQGWLRGTEPGRLSSHKTGLRVQKHHDVPPIKDIAGLRELLEIQSPQHLGYLLLSSELRDEKGPYVRFSIPKRNGEQRPIAAPRFPLKRVQRAILDKILSTQAPHDAAHGFVAGRSIVTNASQHQGRKLLIKFDLHDFFPTIHYFRVVGLFASMGYHLGEGRFEGRDDGEGVAPTLARLCCYVKPGGSWGQAALPQGAPTSPAIANLVCRGLDARLSGLADKMGGTYTRYADDLSFSFDEVPAPGIGRFRWWVDQICQQEGFALNQHKFRVVRNSQRQMVTGIVVNESDALHIPRKERRRFRAILHNCRAHGIASQAHGKPFFKSYLQGFASFVHMVHPEEGKAFIAEVEALLAQEPDDTVVTLPEQGEA